MPIAAVGAAVPRQDLVGSFREFGDYGFIAEEILGVMPVSEMTGVFGVIPVEALTQNVDAAQVKRRPGAKYAKTSWEPQSDDWSLGEWGLAEFVDRQDMKRYGTWFDAEAVAVERVSRQVGRAYEQAVATAVHSTTTFSLVAQASFDPDTDKGMTLANKWDTSSGTPIDDVQLAVEAIRAKTGRTDVRLQINWRQLQVLSTADQLIGRIQYINPVVNNGILPTSTLAALLGVTEIVVAGALKNTANPGQAASLDDIWADSKALVYAYGAGDPKDSPSLGRTVALTGDESITVTVEEQSNPPGREVIASTYRQEKLVHAEAACLLSGVL